MLLIQGSIPGQGTSSHIPQLRVHMLQLEILHAATKIRHSQINECILKKIKIKKKRCLSDSSGRSYSWVQVDECEMVVLMMQARWQPHSCGPEPASLI